MRVLVRLYCLALLIVSTSSPTAHGQSSPVFGCASEVSGRWLKGNTHAHSITFLRGLLPHGDSSPADVARWYRDHGYDFLAITEHNRFIDPESLGIQDDDFLLLRGVEITSDHRLWRADKKSRHSLHTTALNVSDAPSWAFGDQSVSEILQNHLDRIRSAGGFAVINHPNLTRRVAGIRGPQVVPEDLLALGDFRLLEIYNAHPQAKNSAVDGRASTDRIWDELLSSGRRVYGIASDDAHHFKVPDLLTHHRKNFALPGAGWVMVHAEELTEEAVTTALLDGHFYSTTGITLEALGYDRERYWLRVDEAQTQAALVNPYVVEGAHRVESGDEGLSIEFIGHGGSVISQTDGPAAELRVDPEYRYVRAKVTWRVQITTRIDDTPTLREFYAWTQPMFLDSRDNREC